MLRKGLIFLSLFSCLFYAAKSQGIETIQHRFWVDSIMRQMTMEQKIAQLIMIDAYSNKDLTYENKITATIKRYQPGGVIFFQGNSANQIRLTNTFQKNSHIPLMIGLDAEHGVGWRVKDAMTFPKMQVIGAVSDSMVFKLGATIAKHCKLIGVHVNFAPDADINNNILNPVIGNRSFGDNRDNVWQKAYMYIQGSLSQGVIPVAKHFPGHGDTDTDSHLGLPVIQHGRERLDSIELYPFKKLIEKDIPAIMIGHLNVPALDSRSIPSSLSDKIINNLLKKEMAFTGLCFSDAMNMKGVTTGLAPGQAEVQALKAGMEVLLFPTNIDAAIKAIKEAIIKGDLDSLIVQKACRKVLEYKYKFVLGRTDTPSLTDKSVLHSAADSSLRREIAHESITLIQNHGQFLPIQRPDTVKTAILNIGTTSPILSQTAGMYTSVANFNVSPKATSPEIITILKVLKKYNLIIINNNAANNNIADHFGHSQALHSLLDSLGDKKNVVLCHPASPYGVIGYLDIPKISIIVSYDKSDIFQEGTALAIFGGQAFSGKLPVGLDAEHPSGYGIPTNKITLGYESPEAHNMNSKTLEEIDKICQKAIINHATPGCQVLVAKDGYIVYNKAFGYHTYNKNIRNSINDVYDIASITKIAATTLAIMKLYDEGKISLTDKLSDYCQFLKNTDKKDITIYQALCHNSGLPSTIGFVTDAIDKTSIIGKIYTTTPTLQNKKKLKDRLYINLNYKFLPNTLSNVPQNGFEKISDHFYVYPSYRDTVMLHIAQCKLSSPTYKYSDLNFILLKCCIEKVSGQKLNDFCRTEIYDKIGAWQIGFANDIQRDRVKIIPSSIDDQYRRKEIRGSVHDPAAAILGGVSGNAGLFTTAIDLAKIAELLLSKGIYMGDTIIKPSTIDLFTAKNIKYPLNRRGLGFDKPETRPNVKSPVISSCPPTSFGHSGFTGTLIWCDPDNHLTYIFLSNRTYPDEFNTKLTSENVRSDIHSAIYKSISNSEF